MIISQYCLDPTVLRDQVQYLYECVMEHKVIYIDEERVATDEEKNRLFRLCVNTIFNEEAREIAKEFELLPPIKSNANYMHIDIGGTK